MSTPTTQDRSTGRTPAAWPRIEAYVHVNGTADVTIGGTTQAVTGDEYDVPSARAAVIAHVAATAAQLSRPVRALTHDPDGDWPLVIHPDGTVAADPDQPTRPRDTTDQTGETAHTNETSQTNQTIQTNDSARAGAADEPPGGVMPPTGAGGWHVPAAINPWAAASTHPETETETEPATRHARHARESFLTRPAAVQPATHGWRGTLTHLGLRVGPGPAEQAERADTLAVSRHWPGPRTIAVVNGKGGASKTPTTILLSAIFARHGGAGVLAWDNNQTRGTLGWRTEQGPHEATLLDLLPHTDELLGTGAQAADLAHYVHHQTADRYDVLRSQPLALAGEQRARVGEADVDAIHAVAAKYYRLIIMDSGNDESDPVWLRMVDHADQIVIATTTRDDHAEAGALLLEALGSRCPHCAALVEKAVVVVSQADAHAPKTDLERIKTGYAPLAREAVTIPYDPAMVDGQLTYDALRPATRRAWLAAAAAVARGL